MTGLLIEPILTAAVWGGEPLGCSLARDAGRRGAVLWATGGASGVYLQLYSTILFVAPVGAVLLEQNDEWLLQCRCMQIEGMAELTPLLIEANSAKLPPMAA